MKYNRVLLLLGLVVLTTSVVWAQGANPPASTKESGQTSGQGGTATEQSGKEATISGCLSGPSDQGVYTLTNSDYKKGVEVASGEGIDLKSHVGHTVKLTGMWMKTGEAVGEKEKGSEKAERHFKATKVDHIADTCTPSGEEKSK